MKVDKDQISAWGVHAFTGSGAILGFLALVSSRKFSVAWYGTTY